MKPLKIKKMLVAMDLGPQSRQAWRQARTLAWRFQAKVEALHAMPFAPVGIDLVPDRRSVADAKKSVVEALRRECGDGIRLHVEEGEPVPAILRTLRKVRPDLLVMGTHGRTGLGRLVLGSVAEATVRRSSVPVLVARGPAGAVRSILAPVRFESHAVAGLAAAALLAKSLGARLTALNVLEGPSRDGNPLFLLRQLLSRLPRPVFEAIQPTSLVLQGDPARRIVQEAARHDLVVLVEHRKALRDWVLGSVAERVLRRSPASVLCLPCPPPAPGARPLSEALARV